MTQNNAHSIFIEGQAHLVAPQACRHIFNFWRPANGHLYSQLACLPSDTLSNLMAPTPAGESEPLLKHGHHNSQLACISSNIDTATRGGKSYNSYWKALPFGQNFLQKYSELIACISRIRLLYIKMNCVL